MPQSTRRAGVAAVALTAAAAAGLALAAPAQAAGVACGATLTASATLTKDLTCAAGQGLTLDGAVTLDLNGHRLRGPGSGTGITVTDAGVATVRDGRVDHWGTGVAGAPTDDFEPATHDVRITRVRLDHHVTAIDSSTGGFGTIGARTFVVTESLLDHDTRGVSGVYGSSSIVRSVLSANTVAVSSITSGATIRSSVLNDNDTALDCDESGCIVDRNVFSGNGTGIVNRTFGSTITSNLFSRNDVAFTSFGDFGSTLTGNTFTRNPVAVSIGASSTATLTRNTFSRNGSAFLRDASVPEPDLFAPTLLDRNTFTRNTDGIRTDAADTQLEGNRATNNAGYGIYAPNATDLGGNTASGNGTSPQCTGVVCS
ncbi:NosD domain-containing protein [Angustibacter aerolatus]